MQIDLNPQTRGPADPQIPLSPELAKLVADMKLSLGQSLEALVTRVQVVTEAERQELLSQQPAAPKNQAQRQLQSLLQEPALKLVELKIQRSLVPTLTALPLIKAQALQVLLTARGFMLIPPQKQLPTPADPTEALIRQTLTVPPTTAPPAQATTKPVTAPIPSPAPGPPVAGQALAAVQATPAQMANPTGLPATYVPSGHQPPKLPALDTGPLKSDASIPKPGTPATSAEPVGKPVNKIPPGPAVANQIRPLIAETLARALPQAQELPPLLRALGELNRQLLVVPREKLPPQMRELQTLLNKLPGLSLNLAQLNPARPEPLRQALEQSGVFYERRLLQSVEAGLEQAARKLPDQDLKGSLIQIQQWLNSSAPPSPLPTRTQMPDSLSQLLFGLVQVFLPRQKPHPDSSALQQLKTAIQQQVGQSLARIQTQQMRTLNNQLLDPDAPQQWHLDIPLRLPEGYGNLYLHLFEPRLPPEPDKEPEKREQRRQSKGRWRVFMELMLDELGGLAAEISVLDQDLEITLWTEGDTLRERANAHLRELKQDLEQQGLVVRELQCSQHPPPAQKVQLDYALIDIKT
jgi:hypothetical protein